MVDKYFRYLYSLMKYSKELIGRRNKKGLRIFTFLDVIVVLLNDYPNRRVLVWYYYKPTKKILVRVALHGYHAKQMKRKILEILNKIIENEHDYREVGILKRRSYSYKKDKAYQRWCYGTRHLHTDKSKPGEGAAN